MLMKFESPGECTRDQGHWEGHPGLGDTCCFPLIALTLTLVELFGLVGTVMIGCMDKLKVKNKIRIRSHP